MLKPFGFPSVDHIPKPPESGPVKLVIFFGTASREHRYTNVSMLRNLVTLQSRDDIRTSYLAGVGTDSNFIGMVADLGLGIGSDVRQAYYFLLENYDEERGDEIFIFGFSRGAYAARILAAMLFFCGVAETCGLDKNERNNLR